MTTIAYANGIMSADSSNWVKSGNNAYDARKIYRLRNGALVGCAGHDRCIAAFMRWLRAGARYESFPKLKELGAIVVDPKGKITVFDDGTPEPVTVQNKYCAVGVDQDIALGALFVGASAADAVRAAIKHGQKTRGPVHSLKLNRGTDAVANCTGVRSAVRSGPSVGKVHHRGNKQEADFIRLA